MNDLTHEHIEQAFQPAAEVIARLPDSTESREAKRLVDISERLVHEARERARPEGSEQP